MQREPKAKVFDSVERMSERDIDHLVVAIIVVLKRKR
jgi:hypothetical protein